MYSCCQGVTFKDWEMRNHSFNSRFRNFIPQFKLANTNTAQNLIIHCTSRVHIPLLEDRPGRTLLLMSHSGCLYISMLSFNGVDYIICRNDRFVLTVLIFTLWLWWDYLLLHALNRHAQHLSFRLSQRRFVRNLAYHQRFFGPWGNARANMSTTFMNASISVSIPFGQIFLKMHVESTFLTLAWTGAEKNETAERTTWALVTVLT